MEVLSLGAAASFCACVSDIGADPGTYGGPADTEWADNYGDPESADLSTLEDTGGDTTTRDPERRPPPETEEELPADLPPCEGETVRLGTSTLFTVAPLGVGEQHLGRPVDQNFEFIGGPEGASILPRARTFDSAVDSVEHSYIFVENSRGLSASASYFAIGGSVEEQRSRRHAVVSAYDIANVREIDDTAEQAVAPQNAAFFLWRIYYGHSYQALISGTSTEFHAGVRARLGVASGSIQSFVESNNLSLQASGRGLEPISADAIFAHSEEDISSSYSSNGDPVPVFVEYRSIPTACVTDPETFEWVEPTTIQIDYDRLNVYEDGSWGTDTWSLDANCWVDGHEYFLQNPVVWDMHSSVCDSDSSGVAGPSGDGDYCEYTLGWNTRLEVVEGQEIRCGVQGMAWDDNDTVEYSEFRYTVGQDHTPVSGQIGAGNGQTEYWLFYNLLFP